MGQFADNVYVEQSWQREHIPVNTDGFAAFAPGSSLLPEPQSADRKVAEDNNEQAAGFGGTVKPTVPNVVNRRLAASSSQIIDMINSRSALPVAKSSRFLAGLEETATHAIVADAKIRRFSAKHNIASKSHRATHLFLVQSGQAHYYHLTKQGESVLLARLVPGDVIGLAALLKSPSTYRANAEAASDCELLAWDHTVMRKLVSRYPLLMENGLRIGLDLLQIYAQRHIGLVTKTAEERLAETLIRLGHQSGEVRPDGIEIHATNDQLGALADISLFTASRVLRKWGREGILSKKRGRVVLHQPEALMIE